MSMPYIKRRLEAEVPGLAVLIETRGYGTRIRGRYSCSCGKISIIDYSISDSQITQMNPAVPDYIVEQMKDALREHVRSEGNVPSF